MFDFEFYYITIAKNVEERYSSDWYYGLLMY